MYLYLPGEVNPAFWIHCLLFFFSFFFFPFLFLLLLACHIKYRGTFYEQGY